MPLSQGAGSFGVGLLAEGGGDDTYFGNYFVQGAGDTKGFGAIVEAAGNDNYFAGGLYRGFPCARQILQINVPGVRLSALRPWESFVGASGGIGVIAEAEGNDTYVADYFAQGCQLLVLRWASSMTARATTVISPDVIRRVPGYIRPPAF